MSLFRALRYNGKLIKSPITATNVVGDPLSFTERTQAKVNNPNILVSGEYYVVLDEPQIRGKDIENKFTNFAQSHGSILSPSLNRRRQIKITGTIMAGDDEAMREGIGVIRSIFRSAIIPSINDRGLYPLLLETKVGGVNKEYFANCQVLNNNVRINKRDWTDKRVDFSVDLITEDTGLFATEDITETGIIESNIGGMGLVENQQKTLGNIALNEITDGFILDSETGEPTPPVITITLENIVGTSRKAINPKIWNATIGLFVGVDTEITNTDTLVIDMDSRQIFKNGTEISVLQTQGSNAWSLQGGENLIALVDDTPSSVFGNVLRADIQYTPILLY